MSVGYGPDFLGSLMFLSRVIFYDPCTTSLSDLAVAMKLTYYCNSQRMKMTTVISVLFLNFSNTDYGLIVILAEYNKPCCSPTQVACGEEGGTESKPHGPLHTAVGISVGN